MNHLLADTITGIWEVADIEGEECEMLSQQDFFEALSALKEGELVGTTVDAEWYHRIDSEYGIQFLQ